MIGFPSQHNSYLSRILAVLVECQKSAGRIFDDSHFGVAAHVSWTVDDLSSFVTASRQALIEVFDVDVGKPHGW